MQYGTAQHWTGLYGTYCAVQRCVVSRAASEIGGEIGGAAASPPRANGRVRSQPAAPPGHAVEIGAPARGAGTLNTRPEARRGRRFRSAVAGRLTYHDSCHLLRGLYEAESPRALLKELAGAEFVELPGSDECCGFGGSFSVRLPEVSTAILDKKLANIESTGADGVIACDAGCLMQMRGGLARRGSRVRALHLAEVLEVADPR